MATMQFSYDPYLMPMKILQHQTWCTFSQMWNFIKDNAYSNYDGNYTVEQLVHEIKLLKTTMPFSKTRRFPDSLYVHVDNSLIKAALAKIVVSNDQESYTSAFSLLSSYFMVDSMDEEKILVYDRLKFESTFKLTWKRQ